jgi:hypothetical protein
MMAIIMQLSGPPEAKKWSGGTAMSEKLLFDDFEILIQTRMVSSCLFLIGVPVGKHVI